jgi:TM2 domain-containing membrane protein YozV
MYCKHCGDELKSANTIFCTNCNTRVGDGHNFCNECGESNISNGSNCLKCGTFLNSIDFENNFEELNDNKSELEGIPKRKSIAILLALFLGVLGAHRFYIGQKNTAIVMLILGIIASFTFYFLRDILVFWVIVDMFLIGFNKLKPINGYYV